MPLEGIALQNKPSANDIRLLLLLGTFGAALLLFDLYFMKTNLTLPQNEGTIGPIPPFAAVVAQTANLLLLLFSAMGFYFLLQGRVKATPPIVLGGAAVLSGWLAGGGTVSAFLQGAVYGLAVFGLVHNIYGERLLLRNLLPTSRLLLAGLGAFGVHLGVGLIFLWISSWFGATGADTGLRDRIIAAPWPWLLPLAIGFSAALFEELVFRKWMDTYLTALTRSWIVTAFISSFLWSLTHLQYSVSPWYLRIVEITLFTGPVSFWIYKKYGLYPAILGHLLYNAFLVFRAIAVNM